MPLSHEDILTRLLDEHLWPEDAAETYSQVASLAIRLAANCCMVSETVQHYLSQHLVEIRSFITIDNLAEVTIGLLANMVFADNSAIELPLLLRMSFHERIAVQIANGIIATDHPLFDTALEILEALSEEDVDTSVPNRMSTQMAMEQITSGVLTHNDFEQDAFETLVRILLRWASKRELRATSRDLAKVYEATIQREDFDAGASDAEKSLVEPFESILGELASERAVDPSADVEDLVEPANNWIKYSTTQPNARQSRLCATGFLFLCNLCNEAFAVTAVQKLSLHNPTVAVLRDPAKRKVMEICTNAAAFLANLCQPKSNKQVILDTNIVSYLFYDAADVEPELSIKIMRRLVSGGFAPAAAAALDDERVGLPNFKHVVEQLPEQKALQDKISQKGIEGETLGMQAPTKPGEQLTKDIAHIFVDIRRHTDAVTALITPKLVWALFNTILLGLKTRNAFDTSEGVFGLGLALQGEEQHVERLALEAIEAITRNDGLAACRQIMEARKSENNEVARKVAENAMSILVRLVHIGERKAMPTDLMESLRDVLNLGLQGTEATQAEGAQSSAA